MNSTNEKLGLTSTNYSSKKETSDKNILNFNFHTADGPSSKDNEKTPLLKGLSID